MIVTTVPHPTAWQIYATLSFALLLVLPFAAWRWGGAPERRAALMFFGAAAASIALRRPAAVRWVEIDPGLLVVDALLFAGLLGLTLTTDRRWLIFATSIQGISTAAHLGYVTAPTFGRFAYSIMETFSTLPTLIALAIGIAAHRRRLTRSLPGSSAAPVRTRPASPGR